MWVHYSSVNKNAMYKKMKVFKRYLDAGLFLENYQNRNLLGGLYRENPVKSRNYEAVKSSKKWENVGNSYIIPALFLYLSVKYKSFYFFYFSSEPFKFSGCIHLFGDI